MSDKDSGMSHWGRVFLTAEWRDLAMLNYEVDPSLLIRYIPRGTTLDSFKGKTYISLVGFRFCQTKLLGYLPIPFHTDFEEVNVRFYVRRQEGSEIRRGVVFIAEVVPGRAVAAVARLLYGENYRRAPTKHRIANEGGSSRIEFQWEVHGQWCQISAQMDGVSHHPPAGTLEQFITEHYWGYSRQRNGCCLEYRVSHVPWQVWTCPNAGFEGDASAFYGSELGAVLQRRPDSAFVADGSPVIVFQGKRIA
jgi:uncharacterized protein